MMSGLSEPNTKSVHENIPFVNSLLEKVQGKQEISDFRVFLESAFGRSDPNNLGYGKWLVLLLIFK